MTIPLPPPAISAVKSVEESGTNVNPGDLLLFPINYSFVNTTNFQITDTVPPQYHPLLLHGPAGNGKRGGFGIGPRERGDLVAGQRHHSNHGRGLDAGQGQLGRFRPRLRHGYSQYRRA